MTARPPGPSQEVGGGGWRRAPLEAQSEAGHRDVLAESFPVNSVPPEKQMEAMTGLSPAHQSAVG